MVPADIEALATVCLLAAALLGAVGACLALILDGHRLPMIAAALATVALTIVGISVMAGPAVQVRIGEVLGYSLVDVRFDALSGLFLVALGIVGTAASLYSLAYHDAGRSRFDTFAYVVFVASLGLVFGAANAFSFLFAWELMALGSAALVLGPAPDRSAVRAGFVYLAMTHLATAAIAVAFAIWSAAAGSLDFSAWHTAGQAMSGPTRDVVFLLLLVGFGTKAGMMPLHIWLPRAHPAAPSHVSALMSGVMIKAGIFGIIRFGLELLGPDRHWWDVVRPSVPRRRSGVRRPWPSVIPNDCWPTTASRTSGSSSSGSASRSSARPKVSRHCWSWGWRRRSSTP
jgi:hydrogenase-4 component B